MTIVRPKASSDICFEASPDLASMQRRSAVARQFGKVVKELREKRGIQARGNARAGIGSTDKTSDIMTKANL